LRELQFWRAVEERDTNTDAGVRTGSATVVRPALGPAKSRGAGPTALAPRLGDARFLRSEYRVGLQYERDGIIERTAV
jgi:hypothetical protein